MSIRIGIANYGQYLRFIEKIRPELPDDVELVLLNDLFTELESSVKLIEAEKSVDVFVGSGGNAEYLEKYLTEIPLVKVEVTGFDILDALNEVRAYSRFAAVVSFRKPIAQLENIKSLLDIEVKECVYNDREEISHILESLHYQGVQDVVGTAYVLEQAKLFGMRGHFIWSEDSVRTALNRAVVMARYRKHDEVRGKQLSSLLECVSEGVIMTDEKGFITEYNTSAERILSRNKRSVIGKHCEEVLPNLQLLLIMRERRAQYNKTLEICGTKVTANRIPIMFNREVVGSSVAFYKNSIVAKKSEDSAEKAQSFRGFIARTRFEGLDGISPAFIRVRDVAREYAKQDATLLLLGRTGTGKELLAQSMHNASPRKYEPFVTVNCSALPPTILENEFFGYDEGAFSGAKKGGKAGYFELANGGTLFLDEVSSLPLKFQSRLLRAIEEKEYFRIGGYKMVPVDVRIMASSNVDLAKLVEEGTFREDLYYRLNVLELRLPELCERGEDIPLFINRFVTENRGDLTRAQVDSVCSIKHFLDYNWPGNIRELRNVMARFCALYTPGTDVEKLAKEVLKYSDHRTGGKLNEERREILEALHMSGGSKQKAAQILDISRTTLWRRINELGLDEEINY